MKTTIILLNIDEAIDIIQALNSPLRRKMLSLLNNRQLNINQIAAELSIPQSTCAVNIQILEKSKLIRSESVPATKGAQKICTADLEEIVILLKQENASVNDKIIETEMPIGLYTDFNVSPPCGLVSAEKIIGYYDQISSFMNPQRAAASLIWFSKGYLTYRFPKNFSSSKKIDNISVTLEICSEFPGYKNDWPSDITLWINDIEIGTWTSPGDMGGQFGRFTPRWWDLKNTQYGFLKTWKVTRNASFIDGEKCSEITLNDIAIETCDSFIVKIGVKEDAKNLGGLNIFGKNFGNYNKDIIFKVELE